jgi:hypothetical protein
MKLTTHLHLVPSEWSSTSVPLTLYAFFVWAGATFPLSLLLTFINPSFSSCCFCKELQYLFYRNHISEECNEVVIIQTTIIIVAHIHTELSNDTAEQIFTFFCNMDKINWCSINRKMITKMVVKK